VSKIAIVGSRGYVGKNLTSNLKVHHEIIKFSHASIDDFKGYSEKNTDHYSLKSLIDKANEFDLIIFLLESSKTKDREYIAAYLSNLILVSTSTRIVIFSTISVYSSTNSEYVKFKRSLEDLSNNNKNVIILRPGVIFGGIPGGLYLTLRNFRYKSFLVIPSGDAVTGYVHIKSVAKKIIDILGKKNPEKIQNVVDITISLRDAVYFFGFRGFSLIIPRAIIANIFLPFSIMIKYFPRSLQSILSLSSIELPYFDGESPETKSIFRRILFAQFIRSDTGVILKFSLRNFIRNIENLNTLKEYLALTNGQRFIFLKRLSEIYRLSLQDES
jgi:dTDP-4-dehydrorhamnose reductase